MTLTGVGGHFCAAHRDRASGALHGHTWEVEAWFDDGDARDRGTQLASTLANLDHSELPDRLAYGEQIAEHLLALLGAQKVLVRRPAERIFAMAQRDLSEAPNRYCHAFEATCPNNGAVIAYALEIQSQTSIMVEDIVAACSVSETFHEPLADALYAQFGGRQILAAHHHGVDIRTVRGRA